MAEPPTALASTVAIGRSATIHMVGFAVASVAALATAAVIARRVGYHGLGVYALAFGGAMLLSSITRFGLEISAFQHPNQFPSTDDPRAAAFSARRSILVSLVTGTLGGLLLWLAAAKIGTALNQPLAIPMFKAFAPAIPALNLLFVGTATLRGARQINGFVIPRFVLYPGFQFFTILVALYFRLDVTWAAYGSVVAILLADAVVLFLVYRTFPNPSAGTPTSALLAFGGWNFPIQVLQFLLLWVDLAIVGFYLLPEQVGHYRIAAQAALLAAVIGSAFETLYAPLCARLLAKEDEAHLAEATRSAARLVLFLTGGFVVAVVGAPHLLLQLFGPNFEPSIPPFLVLIMAHTVVAALAPGWYLLIMTKRSRQEALANGLALVASVVVAVYFFSVMGMVAAAFGTATGLVVRAALRLRFVSEIPALRPVSLPLLRGLVMFVFLASASRFAPAAGFADFPVAPVLLAALFWFVGYFGLLVPADRTALRLIIRKTFAPRQENVDSPGGPWSSPPTDGA